MKIWPFKKKAASIRDKRTDIDRLDMLERQVQSQAEMGADERRMLAVRKAEVVDIWKRLEILDQTVDSLQEQITTFELRMDQARITFGTEK